MSVKRPKIGDTVIIKGVVTNVTSSPLVIIKSTGNGSGDLYLLEHNIDEIIPAPRQFKPGDKVRTVTNSNNKYGLVLDVIAVHQAPGDPRIYIVAAYKGDKPNSYRPDELELVID